MTFQGETLFALIRWRESIRALAQQKPSPLRSSLATREEKSVTSSLITSDQQLQKDLLTLEAKKKAHLAISRHRGGRKLNRLSYIGLFIGLLILGGLFFMAGYLMSLSLNPSYGGIIFNPKYEAAPSGQPLSSDRRSETDDISVRPDVPQKSYVDRQALIARASNRPEKKGLLEKAEERTFNNVKNQVKDNVVQGVRNLSQKLGNKLGSGMNRMLSPLTQDLPQNLASDHVDTTFNHLSSEENTSGFTFQQDAAVEQNEAVSKTTSDNLSSKKKTIQEKSVEKAVDPEESVSPASSSGLYAIRIHRFAERDSALKLAEELRRKGYDGYIVPVWDEKGHLDFEVRSGSYVTYSEAQSALKVLQQIWHDPGVELPGVVMTRRSEEQIRP